MRQKEIQDKFQILFKKCQNVLHLAPEITRVLLILYGLLDHHDGEADDVLVGYNKGQLCGQNVPVGLSVAVSIAVRTVGWLPEVVVVAHLRRPLVHLMPVLQVRSGKG